MSFLLFFASGVDSGKTDIVVDVKVFRERVTAIARLRARIRLQNGIIQAGQDGIIQVRQNGIAQLLQNGIVQVRPVDVRHCAD